ncbi:MAG: glycosyltransferase family 39 protein [Anaerolineae bacterium]|nr:glycosyltransferase family 39 protein [Anaerolineae bacterium]
MDMIKYRQRVFVLICAIYLVLACAYAILVPPWESPDEPAHYLYVKQLAERARPPLQPTVQQKDYFCRDYAFISSNYEWYQPAVGYLPAAIIYKTLALLAPHSLPHTIPPLNPQFCIDPFTHHNLFIHLNLKMFEIWKTEWGLLIIRLFLSLLGLIVIYAAYRIGNVCDRQNWLGIGAAGWVAFLPQFTFINASVRSDTLTNTVAALVLLFAVLMQLPRANTSRLALAIGFLLGVGLLCKYTFVYILPVGLIAIILTSPRAPRLWIKPFVLMGLPTLILVAIYYLAFTEARAALIYTFNSALRLDPNTLNWKYLTKVLQPLFIEIFFARFGWANVTVPGIFSHIAFALWGIGVVSTLGHLWWLRHTVDSHTQKIILLLSVSILFAIIGVIRFNLSTFQPQGRLLFPALVAWAVVSIWGWYQLLSPRAQKIATITVIVSMLVFNLYALFFALVPAHYK